MKACKKCGKEFDPIPGLVNYCSMKCRQGKKWSEEDKQKKSDANKIKLSYDIIQKIILFYEKCYNLNDTAEYFGYHKSVIKRYISSIENKKSKSASDIVTDWRKKVKLKLIEYKGGACCICGYKKSIRALHFHHLDSNNKSFGIGGKSYSFERLKKEVDKCILICSNCHGEIHDGLIKI